MANFFYTFPRVSLQASMGLATRLEYTTLIQTNLSPLLLNFLSMNNDWFLIVIRNILWSHLKFYILNINIDNYLDPPV